VNPLLRPPSSTPGAFQPRKGLPANVVVNRGVRHWIVGDGDTLTSIASYYGKGQATQELYTVNASIIETVASSAGYGNSHHGLILISGTKLDIPGSW
jgi:hypothetical protein